MKFSIFAAMMVAASGSFIVPASACGPDSRCTVSSGTYFVRLPTDRGAAAKKVGALIYLHGWQSSAKAVMRNRKLAAMADRLGLALIAPNGKGKTWSFESSPSRHRDELRYFRELLDDLAQNPTIDATRIIVSGFSMGGSMTWYLSCYLGERIAGFVPVAGAFWNPAPKTCPSPVPHLVHIHGLSDGVVPMGGRPIGSNHSQGNVAASVKMWERRAGCAAKPQAKTRTAKLMCRQSAQCTEGFIELCLHKGGHVARPAWIERAIKRILAHKEEPYR